MPETDLVQAAPSAQASKGLAVRGLWEVFTKPTAFFTELKNNPKILIPYLIIAIMVAVFFVMTADMIFELQMANPDFQKQMEQQPGMTPERMKSFTTPFTIGGGVVSMLLLPLLASALALFWGNFVFAGRASFSQILSVTLYAGVLFAVGMLLHLPIMLAKGSFAVGYSLAVLAADQGVQSPIFTLLSKISIFHIWEIIVLGIGYATVFGVSKGKGYGIALLSMGLISVIHVVFSLFA